MRQRPEVVGGCFSRDATIRKRHPVAFEPMVTYRATETASLTPPRLRSGAERRHRRLRSAGKTSASSLSVAASQILLLLFQERLEGFKWLKGGDSFLLSGCGGAFRPISDCVALMLVVVAVHAKKLPVAAIRGIVVVVVILVMDRQLPQLFAFELAPATAANGGKQFERLFPVALHPEFPLPAQSGHEIVLSRYHRFTLSNDMPHYSVLPSPAGRCVVADGLAGVAGLELVFVCFPQAMLRSQLTSTLRS
jgi:hypothetical protein